ncbi:MAG TPA: HNH endonuclease, partial [Aeromicrobium sp.]|nr:HNH endonuclease [Aeromicrobium sp.]
VGRTHRRATPRQARAITFRQNDTCASPGCHHPIAHNHHKHWYSNGGRTRLEDMDGRCSKCHTLIHAGHLNIPGYTTDGWPLRQNRRRRTN